MQRHHPSSPLLFASLSLATRPPGLGLGSLDEEEEAAGELQQQQQQQHHHHHPNELQASAAAPPSRLLLVTSTNETSPGSELQEVAEELYLACGLPSTLLTLSTSSSVAVRDTITAAVLTALRSSLPPSGGTLALVVIGDSKLLHATHFALLGLGHLAQSIRLVLVPSTLQAAIDRRLITADGCIMDNVFSIPSFTPTSASSSPFVVRPSAVVIDAEMLTGIPEGVVSVLRQGLHRNEALFSFVETHVDDLVACNHGIAQELLTMVHATAASQDPPPASVTTSVTMEHVLARCADFDPGDAATVSMGLVKEAEISRALGHAPASTVGRLIRLLKALKMPTALHELDYDAVHSCASLMSTAEMFLPGAVVGSCVMRRGIPTVVSGRVLANAVTIFRPLPLEENAHHHIRVPGSKSISNRALLLAAMSQGKCRISGLLHSDDTQVMMTCLTQLGAHFEWMQDKTLLVTGNAGVFAKPVSDLYLSNAGTAARFLISTCTLIADPEHATTMTGSARMLVRPQGPLVAALNENGCEITYLGEQGHLPLRIRGGGLRGGRMYLEGKVSSQFVSSVLIASPFAREGLDLELAEKDPTSISYIDMTVKNMRHFGVHVDRPAINRFVVAPGQRYVAPADYAVEADASSATYPLAIAAITGQTVTVHGVGSESLQGDAGFCALLRDMGCAISQTADATTVVGPRELHGIDVDMGSLTDAFMTAVAVAVYAKGTTRISGIANQHVKECDRIAAMVDELAKCGVTARNLPDGIEVDGVGQFGLPQLKVPALIECYDDHRIAMSFAVVSVCVEKGMVVITDKDCTDKTYPEFWDDMVNSIKLGVEEAAEIAAHLHGSGPPRPFPYATADKSITLVGMRGSGKTHMGRAAAARLGWAFVDLDDELETQEGMKCSAIVEAHGWSGFREREEGVLRRVLAACPERHVIACGGGIVETPSARNALTMLAERGWPVIHIRRSLADIRLYLDEQAANASKTSSVVDGPMPKKSKGKQKEHEGQTAEPGATERRPQYGEPLDVVFTRRLPWFTQVATHQFLVLPGESDWNRINLEFGNFVTGLQQRVTPNVLAPGRFALLVDSAELCGGAVPDLSGYDAVLLSVTLAATGIDVEFDGGSEGSAVDFSFMLHISVAMAVLRRAAPLPIIVSARDLDDPGIAKAALHSGLRCGAEYVELPVEWPEAAKRKVLERLGHARAILSARCDLEFLSSQADAHSASSTMELRVLRDVQLCTEVHGPAAGVLILPVPAIAHKDSGSAAALGLHPGCGSVALANVFAVTERLRARWTRRQVASVSLDTSLLKDVALSRFAMPLNVFTGMTVLREPADSDLVPPEMERAYYLFGSPIQGSPSPTLHNTGFRFIPGPPARVYALCDTRDPERVRSILRTASFAGASVTIPHKETVMKFMDELSDAAKAIGAVNTITRLPDGCLRGDNTDWIGLSRLVERAGVPSGGRALVIGGGGTALAAAYCIKQAGMRLLVWNRTSSKAQAIADKFEGQAVDELEAVGAVDLVIGTIPASSNFTVPDSVLSDGKPVVVDVAYRPRRTALLQQAAAAGCATVEGIEMLVEQGIAQWGLWGGRVGVESEEMQIRKAVMGFYDSGISAQPADW